MGASLRERNVKKEVILSHKFLSQYPDFPTHMNALGKFVYLRTYSRFKAELQRRETWKETCIRSVEYNVGILVKFYEKKGIKIPKDVIRQEAEGLFHNQFNLKQALSGRTLWVGGADTGVAEMFPLANFNCSFLNVSKWDDLGDLFYLLLVGTGVGFKCTKDMAKALPKIRTNMMVKHKPYEPKEKADRLEDTELSIISLEEVEIHVGDSKEGWVQSLRLFLKLLTEKQYKSLQTIRFIYDSVRPKGEKLVTFGGTASGFEPLMEMFTGFDNVLKNKIDITLDPIVSDENGYGKVRPIHILDMGNLIGNNVVVGGVRRTAEIFLFDADDFESLWAKYGVNGYWKEADFQKHEELMAYLDEKGVKYPSWFKKIGERYYDETVNKDFVTGEPRVEEDGRLSPYNLGTGFYHRAMSNNSVAFTDKPTENFLEMIMKIMKSEGEPGFINLRAAAIRRLRGIGLYHPSEEQLQEEMVKIGLNPCAEILLNFYGVCNLTTVNVDGFVYKGKDGKYHLDFDGLIEAQKKSARAGLRMTLVELELPHWDAVQQRDRLLGTSLTGWKDAMHKLGYNRQAQNELLKVLGSTSRTEANRYAEEIGVNIPRLATTVKPEGTQSQMFGGKSPGLHEAHSEYYIRRVRINAEDPLAKAVMAHKGWVVNPENGTPGNSYAEKMKNARTLVIDFPVYSGSKTTKDDVTVNDQFDTYFDFQKYYTEHNSSNTITVKPHEWADAQQRVWDGWDDFVGVSFLSHDGGTYQLPPYQSISKEQYEKLNEQMTNFDMNVLVAVEKGGIDESSLDGTDGCDNGICPIR